jgi:hypothetical protein
MIALPRLGSLLALVAAAAALAMAFTVPAAQSASLKTCVLTSKDQYPAGGKPTYNTSLKAQAVPCATATKVMRAFQKCRAKGAVSCSKKVLGTWRCTGKSESTNPVTKDFTAGFTCKSGARAVKGAYQQDV